MRSAIETVLYLCSTLAGERNGLVRNLHFAELAGPGQVLDNMPVAIPGGKILAGISLAIAPDTYRVFPQYLFDGAQ